MVYKEIFAPFTRYQINEDGQIRRKLSDNSYRTLSPGIDSTGYRRVLLYPTPGHGHSKRRPFRIHALVGRLFTKPFKGHHLRMIDNNKKNVKASNLTWTDENDVGVYQDANTGNWLAVQYKGGRKIFLGYHASKKAAQNARQKAGERNQD